MNKDTKEVMMTVREWAEKSGLKLHNYDGFTEIYSKLSENTSNDFYTSTVNRFRDAGELLCTRKAFESAVSGCTMKFPQISDYDKIADVIPEFVESDINLRISISLGQLRNNKLKGNDLRTELENLLNLMKHKVKVREKSIKMNEGAGEAEISDLDETFLDASDIEIIKKHNGTLESFEEKLSQEIIQSLEQTLQRKNPKLSQVPLDKVKILKSILYNTARQKTNPKIEEEFMYIDVPTQKKEPFVQRYNVIDGEGIRSGVAFDLETENGRVSGTMPTTPEMDEKIKKATSQKPVVDSVLSIEETSKSLQVIDNEVEPEERRSLTTRIKEFARKLLDKIKGKNEER